MNNLLFFSISGAVRIGREKKPIRRSWRYATRKTLDRSLTNDALPSRSMRHRLHRDDLCDALALSLRTGLCDHSAFLKWQVRSISRARRRTSMSLIQFLRHFQYCTDLYLCSTLDYISCSCRVFRSRLRSIAEERNRLFRCQTQRDEYRSCPSKTPTLFIKCDVYSFLAEWRWMDR